MVEIENSLTVCCPALKAEWAAEENAPLKFSDLTAGSHRIVWWRCPKRHLYRSQVKSRVQGTGCPVCAGRVVLPDENSLAARYPDLVSEWDAEKNAPLLPTQVSAGTLRKVWWRCLKGHSWRASIASRTSQNTDCPYCTGHAVLPGFNDLPMFYPAQMQEWNSKKNSALRPETLRLFNNRRVWRRCPLGHSYTAAVSARTMRGNGCPCCAGRKVLVGFDDLETKAPAVAAQWHPTLNAPLPPQQVTAGSNRKIWWMCSIRHVWKATIASRTGKQQCACPVCAGKTIDKYANCGKPRNIICGDVSDEIEMPRCR